MTFRTRFAPSPTGPLHLGHAYSALLAWRMAQEQQGDFLLRIEDIDQSRARPHWEAQIYDDLAWLGIDWSAPPLRQSDRLPAYRAALEGLWAQGLLYTCTCSRKDIDAALAAPQEGHTRRFGPDGVIYPGTCRARGDRSGPLPHSAALRLDLQRALSRLPDTQFQFQETGPNAQGAPATSHAKDTIYPALGDIVLARRDMGTSYHLSVVLDDAHQDITHVVRGEDLYDATLIHVVLQRLLGLPTPIYHHHRLIRDDQGKRLAKRDDARAIATYRAEGATPQDIKDMISEGEDRIGSP